MAGLAPAIHVFIVIPAEAGIQPRRRRQEKLDPGFPAFAEASRFGFAQAGAGVTPCGLQVLLGLGVRWFQHAPGF
jgi:hypothetical protein